MHFIAISAISVGLIAITCLIAYEMLRAMWSGMPNWKLHPRLRILLIMCTVFSIHILNIWIYAFVIFILENMGYFGALVGAGHVAGWHWQSFEDCLYLATASYTTIGFGDIVPTSYLRMIAGTSALNGLVMIGWTISFTYLALERFWTLPHEKHREKK